MVPGVAVLFLVAVVIGLSVVSVVAWLRASEVRDDLREVRERLAALERQAAEGAPAPAAALRDAPAAAAPRPAPAPAQAPARRAASQAEPEDTSLEERIALVWLSRIGAGILVVGAAVFLFYGPTGGAGAGRLAAAGVAGVAALGFAELQRKKARPLFLQVVLGLGSAVLSFAAVASAALYQVAPPGLALAGAAAMLALGALLAVRHDTEVPLVLTLAGALAAPALVWKDAAAGPLMAWLWAAGAVALAVAVWRNFRLAAWAAAVGATAALVAWWARAWDVRPGAAYELVGARAVPLAFAAAFVALWLAAGSRARRLGRARIGPRRFLISTLVLGHALFAALLWDQPPLLTAAAAALALAGLWLLPAEEPWTLLAPAVVSFAILLAADHAESPAVTFLPLAVWGAAYVWGMGRLRLRVSLPLAAVAGILFLVVAGELLAHLRWRAFGLVTVAWSFAFAWLAMRRRASWLLAVTGAVAFLGLLGAALPLREHGDHVLLALGGGWVLVHLGGLAFRIRSQQETPDWRHIITASGTGVVYGALVTFLAPDEPLVRGALAAAVGAAHVVLGGMLLARAPRAGNVLQAVAVGLFAASAMHVLPGVYSTLAWAVLGMLLIWAGFRRRTRLLRVLGLGLFAVTITRVAVWDVWQRPMQVGGLFAVGATLLFASYLYARLGGRLKAVLEERRAAPAPASGPDA